jgi:hypothetical protein
MQELTDVMYHTSNQHKESGISWQQRECKYTQIVIDLFEQSSPFESDPLLLRSLGTGMTAAENVNADKAVEVEKKILDGMVGKSLNEHSFKRKYQSVFMMAKQKK